MSAASRKTWVLGMALAFAGSLAAAEVERAAAPPQKPTARARAGRAVAPGRRAQPPVIRERVLRTWQDTFKTDDGEVARRGEVVFDYTAGLAREDSYDLAGNLIASRPLPGSQPTPSEAEAEEAIAIINADPSLARIISRTSARAHGYFGLEEREDLACGPRTRCLQVLFVTPDGYGLVRRIVVDLTKGAVVYRAYIPSEDTGPSDTGAGTETEAARPRQRTNR